LGYYILQFTPCQEKSTRLKIKATNQVKESPKYRVGFGRKKPTTQRTTVEKAYLTCAHTFRLLQTFQLQQEFGGGNLYEANNIPTTYIFTSSIHHHSHNCKQH
jgi:hypothetical protein